MDDVEGDDDVAGMVRGSKSHPLHAMMNCSVVWNCEVVRSCVARDDGVGWGMASAVEVPSRL